MPKAKKTMSDHENTPRHQEVYYPYLRYYQHGQFNLNQMSNYPPPPHPDQHHYNNIYAAPAGSAQHVLNSGPSDQLHYNGLFPKVDLNGTPGQHATPSGQQMQQMARELQQHNTREEMQQQRVLPHHHPHQIQHIPVSLPLPGNPPIHAPAAQLNPQEASQKSNNRLRKACDSCSIRKVKCDEAGPPCRACAALDIPCTFNRPSRRRGPPNRHAEAIKRQRLEETTTDDDSHGFSSHDTGQRQSPNHAAEALAALSSSSSAPLRADLICPFETMDLLIDEFFTYIHPLCPFPHEPTFRASWNRREDETNKSFLALLSSMIGALVASFPRKPRIHLKAQRSDKLFPNHMSLVHKCQKVCADARGPGYLENENLNVYDAATSYFLALTGMYTYRWRQGRLYFGECLSILRTLGLHKEQGQTSLQLGTLPAAIGSLDVEPEERREQISDCITIEIGRRIFWTMFSSVKAMAQLGANFGELFMPPPTRTEPYPPLPTEVDDEHIFADHIEKQSPGILPLMAGFNANIQVYSVSDTLASLEMAWGIDAVADWDKQRRVLHEALQSCKAILSRLPSQLRIATNSGNTGGYVKQPPHTWYSRRDRDPAKNIDNPMFSGQTAEEKRALQYEIQKANIYASSLATRNYLVQKYWNLREVQKARMMQDVKSNPGNLQPLDPSDNFDDALQHQMREEGESIIIDLLTVLSSIDHVNIEPNADSFTMKIRSIAATLIDLPDDRKGAVAMQSQQYLDAFLKILMKLERTSPTDTAGEPDGSSDDEAELRVWANLREYQRRFAAQGGLLNYS